MDAANLSITKAYFYCLAVLVFSGTVSVARMAVSTDHVIRQW
jgi:hypothetical protein